MFEIRVSASTPGLLNIVITSANDPTPITTGVARYRQGDIVTISATTVNENVRIGHYTHNEIELFFSGTEGEKFNSRQIDIISQTFILGESSLATDINININRFVNTTAVFEMTGTSQGDFVITAVQTYAIENIDKIIEYVTDVSYENDIRTNIINMGGEDVGTFYNEAGDIIIESAIMYSDYRFDANTLITVSAETNLGFNFKEWNITTINGEVTYEQGYSKNDFLVKFKITNDTDIEAYFIEQSAEITFVIDPEEPEVGGTAESVESYNLPEFNNGIIGYFGLNKLIATANPNFKFISFSAVREVEVESGPVGGEEEPAPEYEPDLSVKLIAQSGNELNGQAYVYINRSLQLSDQITIFVKFESVHLIVAEARIGGIEGELLEGVVSVGGDHFDPDESTFVENYGYFLTASTAKIRARFFNSEDANNAYIFSHWLRVSDGHIITYDPEEDLTSYSNELIENGGNQYLELTFTAMKESEGLYIAVYNMRVKVTIVIDPVNQDSEGTYNSVTIVGNFGASIAESDKESITITSTTEFMLYVGVEYTLSAVANKDYIYDITKVEFDSEEYEDYETTNLSSLMFVPKPADTVITFKFVELIEINFIPDPSVIMSDIVSIEATRVINGEEVEIQAVDGRYPAGSKLKVTVFTHIGSYFYVYTTYPDETINYASNFEIIASTSTAGTYVVKYIEQLLISVASLPSNLVNISDFDIYVDPPQIGYGDEPESKISSVSEFTVHSGSIIRIIVNHPSSSQYVFDGWYMGSDEQNMVKVTSGISSVPGGSQIIFTATAAVKVFARYSVDDSLLVINGLGTVDIDGQIHSQRMNEYGVNGDSIAVKPIAGTGYFLKDIRFYRLEDSNYVDFTENVTYNAGTQTYTYNVNDSNQGNNRYVKVVVEFYAHTWASFSGVTTYGNATNITGSGTAIDPYILDSAKDLGYLAWAYSKDNPNAATSPYTRIGVYYKLGNNINLSALDAGISRYWVPIGTWDTKFSGTIDGAGYKITGMTIFGYQYSMVYGNNYHAGNGDISQGFFGVTEGATILNLDIAGTINATKRYVDSQTIENEEYTDGQFNSYEFGGIVGVANNTSFISNTFTGGINVTHYSDDYVHIGGIVSDYIISSAGQYVFKDNTANIGINMVNGGELINGQWESGGSFEAGGLMGVFNGYSTPSYTFVAEGNFVQQTGNGIDYTGYTSYITARFGGFAGYLQTNKPIDIRNNMFILGFNANSTYSQSLNQNSQIYIGGFAGEYYHYASGIINLTNNIYYGFTTISKTANDTRVSGVLNEHSNNFTNLNISNFYYNNNMYGTLHNTLGTSRSVAQLLDVSTFSEFNFNYPWGKGSKSDGVGIHLRRNQITELWSNDTTIPTVVNGEYKVSTASELAWIAKNITSLSVNKVKLISNINLSGKLWTPFTIPAGVVIDGSGFTVTGLTTIALNGTQLSGFVNVNNGTLRHFIFNEALAYNAGEINGRVAIAVLTNNSIVESIKVNGDVQIYGITTNALNAGQTEYYTYFSILVARNSANATVRYSSVSGNFTFYSKLMLGAYAYNGSLIGENYSLLEESYSTATLTHIEVNALNQRLGGLVGILNGDGEIKNAYFAGHLNTADNGENGYILGRNQSANVKITNTYSVGTAGNANYMTGLIGGILSGTNGTYTSNYILQGTYNGTLQAGITSKTANELKTQSTFVGWNFTDIWAYQSGINYEYPILINTANTHNLTVHISNLDGLPQEGGYVTPTPNAQGIIKVVHGNNIAIEFHTHENYVVKQVTVDGAVVTTSKVNGTDTYLFENVTDDHDIEVVYEFASFVITTSSSDSALGTALGGGTYKYNTQVTLTVSLFNSNVGVLKWQFKHVESGIYVDVDTLNGYTYNSENYSLTFNVNADMEGDYRAVFVRIYSITATITPENSGDYEIVVLNPTQGTGIINGKYIEGEIVSIIPSPNEEYVLNKYLFNSVEVVPSANYTFDEDTLNILASSVTSGNYVIELVLKQLSIEIVLDNGGNIDPAPNSNGVVTALYGDTVEFTITATDGFGLYQLYLDDVLIKSYSYAQDPADPYGRFKYTETDTYTIYSINENHVLRVEFQQLNWMNQSKPFEGMNESTGIQVFGGNSLNGRTYETAYVVQTADEVARIAYLVNNKASSTAGAYNSAYYRITRDNNFTFYFSRYFWTPIGLTNQSDSYFAGHIYINNNIIFDGISYLAENDPENIETNSRTYVAFIGYSVNSRLININLQNVNININTAEVSESNPNGLVTTRAAGLVGHASRTVIENAKVSGTIVSNSTHTAGVVAVFANGGALIESTSNTSITVNRNVSGRIGGLVAELSSFDSILNSYYNGNITFTGTTSSMRIGGLVGHAAGLVQNVYTDAVITTSAATTNVGAVFGSISTISTVYENIYYIHNVTSAVQREIGNPSTSGASAQISQGGKGSELSYANFSFATVWTITANGPVFKNPTVPGDTSNIAGTGSEEDPYQIANYQHINFIRARINNTTSSSDQEYFNSSNIYYELVSDINLNNMAFEPFTDFKANLNGNGYTFKNVYINKPFATNVGLVTRNYGVIKNVSVESDFILGYNYVGGIVGINEGAIINTYFNGKVYGFDYVGGIAGESRNANATIYRTSSKGNVFGRNYIGGIVGRLSNVLISEEFNDRFNLETNSFSGIVESYNEAFILGYTYTGGISGRSTRSGSEGLVIKNAYNVGTVRSRQYAAGILGRSEYSNIDRVYNYGDIQTANSYIAQAGELLSYVSSGTATISNAYFNTDNKRVYNLSDGVRTNTASGVGDPNASANYTTVNVVSANYNLMTNQQNVLYTSFNFNRIWAFYPGANSGLPVLRYAYSVVIKVTVGEHGEVSTAYGEIDEFNEILVLINDSITLNYVANPNYYHVNTVAIDGTIIEENTNNALKTYNYTFLNVIVGHTIHVTFDIDKFNIFLITTPETENDEPIAQLSGEGIYSYGENVILTATNLTRYKLVNIKLGSTELLNSDGTVKAAYEDIYSITITTTDGSDVSVTLEFVANATTTGTYNFEFIKQYEVYLSVYQPNTGTATGDGISDITGFGLFTAGSNIPLYAVPRLNYGFEKWMVNGAQASVNANFTYTNIQSNLTIVAHFVLVNHTITLDLLDSNGSVHVRVGQTDYATYTEEGEYEIYVPVSGVFSLNVVPNSGYVISRVTDINKPGSIQRTNSGDSLNDWLIRYDTVTASYIIEVQFRSELWTDNTSTSLSGSGTSSDPYQLTKGEDFGLLVNVVNGAVTDPAYSNYNTATTYFKVLPNNNYNVIDLSAKFWKPMGLPLDDPDYNESKQFKGIILGNGATITTILVESTNSVVGFFTELYGTVENLTFTNLSYNSSATTSTIGGVVGMNYGTLRNIRTGTAESVNIFEKEMEQGDFSWVVNNPIEKIPSSYRIRTANAISVKPNTTYTFALSPSAAEFEFAYLEVNASNNLVKATGYASNDIARSFTTQSTTTKLYLSFKSSSGSEVAILPSALDTYGVILVKGSTAPTEYEPFAVVTLKDITGYGITANAGVTGGVIGKNYGSLTNVTSNVKINATGTVGGVAGENFATINKAKNHGSVNGNIAGGIIGLQNDEDAVATVATNQGNVTGVQTAGGVIGELTSGELTDAYNISAVSATTTAGGIVGKNTNNTFAFNVSNVYNVGLVTAATRGAIFGTLATGTVNNLINAYFLSTLTSTHTQTGALSKTEQELQTATTFVGFNFNSPWRMKQGYNNSMPMFIELETVGNWLPYATPIPSENIDGSTYLISTAEQLAWVAKEVNRGTNFTGITFELANDIDLFGKNFTSIGNSVHNFISNLNGKGYSIINYTFISDNFKENELGIIGSAATSVEKDITNINLIDGYIKVHSTENTNAVGLLIGNGRSVKVNNVTETGSYLELTGSAESAYVGGLLGVATHNSELSRMFGNAIIYATVGNVGGFIGQFVSSSIEYSRYTGEIHYDYNVTLVTSNQVGGIISNASGVIVNEVHSGAKMLLSSTYQFLEVVRYAGIIGYSVESAIANSYFNGSLNFNVFNNTLIHAGYLVGRSYTNTSISNSYSVGTSNVPSNIANLTGPITSSNFSNNFILTGTYNGSSLPSGVTAKSSAELKQESTFNTWNFNEIWAIDYTGSPLNNGYPVLYSLEQYYEIDITIINENYDTLAISYGTVTRQNYNGVNNSNKVVENGNDIVFVLANNNVTFIVASTQSGSIDRVTKDGVIQVGADKETVNFTNVTDNHELIVEFIKGLFSMFIKGTITADSGQVIQPGTTIIALLQDVENNKTYLIILTHNQTIEMKNLELGEYKIIVSTPMFYAATIINEHESEYVENSVYEFDFSSDKENMLIEININKVNEKYLNATAYSINLAEEQEMEGFSEIIGANSAVNNVNALNLVGMKNVTKVVEEEKQEGAKQFVNEQNNDQIVSENNLLMQLYEHADWLTYKVIEDGDDRIYVMEYRDIEHLNKKLYKLFAAIHYHNLTKKQLA